MPDETENPAPAPPRPALPVLHAGGEIAAIIPTSFEDVQRLARYVFASGLAPRGFKTEAAIGVAIMHGLELGLKPMQALQGISVINGRPSVYGDVALGLAMTSGFLADHDEFVEGEGDGRIGVCRVERQGMKPIERRFTVDQAKKAGLWQDQARVERFRDGRKVEVDNDSPWFRFQDRMLVMRARGFALRDRFADVLKGLPIYEEMRDLAAQDREDREGGGGTAEDLGSPPATGNAIVPPPTRGNSNGGGDGRKLDATETSLEAGEASAV
jgi:hypothetical protein